MNRSLRDTKFDTRTSYTTSHKSLSKSLNKSVDKNPTNGKVLDNIEFEYIKNLQQQVYYLELECQYLRKQLDLNGLQSSLKYDQKSTELKTEMHNLKSEKNNLERSLREENMQKETVLNMLENNEKNFQKERSLLLQEINSLKNQKVELEHLLVSKNVEVSKLKENLDKHHLNMEKSNFNMTKSESQIDLLREDNLQLRAELNEARNLLISRDNLIKRLQSETDDNLKRKTFDEVKNNLNDISFKLTKTSESLNREMTNSKLLSEKNMLYERELDNYKHKINELLKENSKLSTSLEISLKQNEADLIMAKKNADLAKLNIEKIQHELENEKNLNNNLRTQIEQFKLEEKLQFKNQSVLRKRVTELEDSLSKYDLDYDFKIKSLEEQLKAKQHDLEMERVTRTDLISKNTNLDGRINELNDAIEKLKLTNKVNVESSKTKINQLQSELDNLNITLNNEINNNRNLQQLIDNFNRQESIQTNLISSLKSKINELESIVQDYSLKESNMANQMQDDNLKILRLQEENDRLASEIQLLSVRIKEIDRLKQIEDLIQSQRWNELGELADNMKNLSQVMSTSINRSANFTNDE